MFRAFMLVCACIIIATPAANAEDITIPLPKLKSCGTDGIIYPRTTTKDLAEAGLMMVCDSKVGAVNVMEIDDVTLVIRPLTPPVYLDDDQGNTCVATAVGDGDKPAYAGCRIEVESVTINGGKVLFNTVGKPHYHPIAKT